MSKPKILVEGSETYLFVESKRRHRQDDYLELRCSKRHLKELRDVIDDYLEEVESTNGIYSPKLYCRLNMSTNIVEFLNTLYDNVSEASESKEHWMPHIKKDSLMKIESITFDHSETTYALKLDSGHLAYVSKQLLTRYFDVYEEELNPWMEYNYKYCVLIGRLTLSNICSLFYLSDMDLEIVKASWEKHLNGKPMKIEKVPDSEFKVADWMLTLDSELEVFINNEHLREYFTLLI